MLESLFNEVAGLKDSNRDFTHRCFPVNIAKFSRIVFFIEHLRWMLVRLYRAVMGTSSRVARCCRFDLASDHSLQTELSAEVIDFLEPTINNVFSWFKNNGLVANSGKSQFLVSPYEKINLKILGSTVECSAC